MFKLWPRDAPLWRQSTITMAVRWSRCGPGRPKGGRFWLKAPGGAVTRPANGKPLTTSAHKHGLMYATRLEPILALITAMQEDQPMQVGFYVISQSMEVVFFGKVQLTDAETAQFSQCFMEWSDALDRRLREPPKN